MPDHPALRYYGGKFRLAPWIISFFPEHVCYVEPYGGAMSVLLQKPPSPLEVYNDLDDNVVAFFRVLRDRHDELIEAIRLTPFSRTELKGAFIREGMDDLEKARLLYVRAWQSIGGPRTQWQTGWRTQKSVRRGKRSIDDFNETSHLYEIADRLKGVYIENDPALKVIARYNTKDTLLYCDPPYLPETRSKKWRHKSYGHEMTEDDHRELAAALREVRGMVILSGYPSELYDDLYAGWTCHTQMSRTNTYINGGTSRIECLWLNPAAARAAKQLSLIGG